jgi:integrase/recombinase XerD
MKLVEIACANVKGKEQICLYFPYDEEIISLVKTIQGAYWDSGLKCWIISKYAGGVEKLNARFNGRLEFARVELRNTGIQETRGISGVDLKNVVQKARVKPKPLDSVIIKELQPLEADDLEIINSFKQWMEFRRYSESTVTTYVEMVKTFLRFIKPKRAAEDIGEDVQRFTNEYILPKQLSFSYQNQLVNAVKLFYREIIRQKLNIEQVRRPRPIHTLPNVLSKQEVKKILMVLKNIKHRVMLSTIYSCGLRRGELLKLKPADIDSNRGLLIIRQAKGNRDRVVPIPAKIIEMLREYYIQYHPARWLFEGAVPGTQYDERSLQQVLKKAILLAGIKKPVTLHWLRHSYATHLHESGVDIRYIQELLGHKSTKTTEIYTHVSNRSIQLIRSPFDDL